MADRTKKQLIIKDTYAILKLTKNQETKISLNSIEKVSKHKWYALSRINNRFDAVAHFKRKTLYLSRYLLELETGNVLEADHINGDCLDNRLENLRICTHKENTCNKGPSKNNKTGFLGVSWSSPMQKWRARVFVKGKEVMVGYFSSPEEAAKARLQKAKELYGDFARDLKIG